MKFHKKRDRVQLQRLSLFSPFFGISKNEHLFVAIIAEYCCLEMKDFLTRNQWIGVTYHDNDKIQPTPGIVEIGFETQSNPLD